MEKDPTYLLLFLQFTILSHRQQSAFVIVFELFHDVIDSFSLESFAFSFSAFNAKVEN